MALRYEGVKKGYPRLRKRFGKLTGYVQLVRPFTLIAPLLAGFFGVLAPVHDLTFTHVSTALYVGLTLALAQGCGQCLNSYADVELDKIVKPYRPIPSGLVAREEALGLAWLLAIFATGRAFTISTFFGLIVLTLIFFAVFYSLAPFSPRKTHPLVNTGWMALSRGFLPVLAVWSVYGDVNKAWQYSVLAFLWVMGFQATKDVPDAKGDKAYGIRTIPNSYGQKGLIVTMVVCSVLYTALSVYFSAYVMLLSLPFATLAIVTTGKQSRLTENTYAWLSFYFGLGLIYILIFTGERFIL